MKTRSTRIGKGTISRSLTLVAAFIVAEAIAAPKAEKVGAYRPNSLVQPRPETEGNKALDKAEFINLFSLVPSGSAGRLGLTVAVSDDPHSELQSYRSSFDLAEVEAKPGYFSVPLKDNQAKVDFTATQNVAAYRFTFPASKGCHVVLDISQPLDQFQGGEIKLSDFKTFEGFGSYKDEDGKKTTLFFSFQFSKSVRRWGSWENETLSPKKNMGSVKDGSPLGYFGYFWDTNEDETILMKVGVSEQSIADARENIVKEFPGWDFKQLCRESEQAWKNQSN